MIGCAVILISTTIAVAAGTPAAGSVGPVPPTRTDAVPLPGTPGQWPIPTHFDRLTVVQLSGTHSIVAGQQALIGVGLPGGVPAGSVHLLLNGRDVTGALHRDSALDPAFPGLVGLLTGLRTGPNDLRATADSAPGHADRSGGQPDRLTLYDYPATGPIFAGPQQRPWFCTTTQFGLGPATDAACDAPTQIRYLYRSTGGAFTPLTDLRQPPPDVASTTTSDGRTVPYFVRLETGTLDRGVYQLALLDNPYQPGQPGTRGWNRRLVYNFGGGCDPGPDQGIAGTLTDPLSGDAELALAKGYAVASSTLTAYQNSCNEVLAAEATLMVKQRFVDTYGVPAWTVGRGGPGGSVEQMQIAENYPGLLNGITPGQTFPDVTTVAPTMLDCSVLDHYFGTTGLAWSPAQEAAVEGFVDPATCGQSWVREFPSTLVPTDCPAPVPVSVVYNPITNPGGVRCDLFDATANVYGRDPATGFGYRFYSNVGVQYGLTALRQGTISGAQFVDLNQRAGGLDRDGRLAGERTASDGPAVRAAYRTGRIDEGQGGLLDIPILDLRPWDDDHAVDPHDEIWSLLTRDRLDHAAGGAAGNYVNWVFHSNLFDPTSPKTAVDELALDTMARWLDAIAADSSARPLPVRIAADRPADAVDACFTDDGVRHDGTVTVGGTNFCSTAFPAYANPRLAAGAGPLDDVLDCQRKPVDATDYAGRLTAPQLARLRQIFPSGVCDYTRPSRDWTPFQGTWLRFRA